MRVEHGSLGLSPSRNPSSSPNPSTVRDTALERWRWAEQSTAENGVDGPVHASKKGQWALLTQSEARQNHPHYVLVDEESKIDLLGRYGVAKMGKDRLTRIKHFVFLPNSSG